jgi:hypothetical protein
LLKCSIVITVDIFFKFQISNPKLQIIPKFQLPNLKRKTVLEFEV